MPSWIPYYAVNMTDVRISYSRYSLQRDDFDGSCGFVDEQRRNHLCGLRESHGGCVVGVS